MKDVIQRTCSTDAFIRDKRLDALDENFLLGQVLWRWFRHNTHHRSYAFCLGRGGGGSALLPDGGVWRFVGEAKNCCPLNGGVL